MVLELDDNSSIFFDVEFSEIICKNDKMKTGRGVDFGTVNYHFMIFRGYINVVRKHIPNLLLGNNFCHQKYSIRFYTSDETISKSRKKVISI